MTTINYLTPAASVKGNDLLPLYTNETASTRRISVTQLLSYFQTAFASPDAFTQSVTPGEGANVQVTGGNPGQSVWLIIRPASSLSDLTITLPLNTNAVDKQEVEVNNTLQVTTLTIGNNGATNVFGAPSTLSAEDKFKLRFDSSSNSWYAV